MPKPERAGSCQPSAFSPSPPSSPQGASALGLASAAHIAVVAGACLVAMAVLSIDLAGTTPWYGSYINTFHNKARIELIAERCTGAAECVQVYPRDVLKMNGPRRKVEISPSRPVHPVRRLHRPMPRGRATLRLRRRPHRRRADDPPHAHEHARTARRCGAD